MNLESSTEAERQLARYGAILAASIENERVAATRSGSEGSGSEGSGSEGSVDLVSVEPELDRAFASWRRLALVGGGLVAACAVGLWALSLVSASPDPPLVAADVPGTETVEEDAVGSEEAAELEDGVDRPVDGLPTDSTEPPLVTIDIFSGRPNPTFVLTEGEAAALRQLVESLPEAAGAVVPEGTLGFRGFGLEDFWYRSDRFSMRVVEDLVVLRRRATDGGPDSDEIIAILDDPERKAHQILRTAATPHIGELIESVPLSP
jgi:hypothetical protein